MSLKKLPQLHLSPLKSQIHFKIREDVLDRWPPPPMAAAKDGDQTISIFDPIGRDADVGGEGVSAKRISAALGAIGQREVLVNINSPGGSLFEGIAIYNLLVQHAGKVTVNVLGLAASAASVIAMAGDDIQMGEGAFLMIHNAWSLAIGNRHDLAEAAQELEPFDAAMAQLYAQRTGRSIEEMRALMDATTWLNPSDAIDQGFADGRLQAQKTSRHQALSTQAFAARQIENALRAAGMSKKAAMTLIHNVKTSAGDPAGHGAGDPTERDQDDLDAEIAARLLQLTLTTTF